MMTAADYIQLALLIVTMITLLAVFREMAIQNRGLRAQLLRDRFDMYRQNHEPVSDDHLREVHAMPDDYVDLDKYQAKYRHDTAALRKYMGCFHRYEYLAFCYSLKRLNLPDPLGYAWTERWTNDLVEHQEFIDVHEYHRAYYPDFAILVDRLISSQLHSRK